MAFAFSRNLASPVDSASSIIKMSGFMCTATEKATRADMPELYVRIGISMNSPSSVHSATSSARSSTSARVSPVASPPRMMFSRPDRLGLKPTPSASNVLALPQTSIEPRVGGRMPAIARINVDLPAPLEPMMPIEVPLVTSKLTSLMASTSKTPRSPAAEPHQSRLQGWLALEGGPIGDVEVLDLDRERARPVRGLR